MLNDPTVSTVGVVLVENVIIYKTYIQNKPFVKDSHD